MALGSANPLLLAASGGDSDPVTRSLRFESGSTHRLTKTFGSAPTSNKVSTLAFWVKRSKLGSGQHIISANGTSHSENTNSFYVQFKTDDTLRVSSYPDPQTNVFTLTTSRKFRDVGAWMHIAILINTDESAAADRCKIYINGVREPSANLSGTNPSSGATNHLLGKATTTWYGSGSVNVQHCIGDEADRFRYKYSGYLADFYFVDGSAIEPVGNFTESTGYGSYKPKAFDMSSYSGNSFHLKFEDSSDIGSDSTSNSNDFSVTNLSSHDVMLDTPTKNYATMSPVSDYVNGGSNTFSEGNLRVDSTNAYNKIASTIAVSSGKWYAEVQGISGSADLMLGIGKQADIYSSLFTGQSGNYAYMIYCYDGRLQHNGNQGATGVGAVGDTDILQIALDLDNNKVWWGKNGTWVGTVGSSGGTTITSGEYFFLQGYRDEAQWNFGQDRGFSGTKTSGQDTSQSEFYYAPPEGFKSLNTSNLDAPTVTPSEHFNTVLWAGSGSQDNDISGVGFQPNFTWVKNRTSNREHALHDSVRGAGKEIRSNSTNTESDKSTMFGPFQSDGFRVAESSVGGAYNDSGNNYVAWNWKAHQSPSSGSGSTTTYTVKVEDNSDDAWDSGGSYYDGSYFPTVYMELFENRNSSLVSLGSVAVRSYDDDGNDMSDYSEQTYTLQCADLDAIAVKWHYDTSGDGDEYDYPYSYNDYLNDQKITILDGTTSEWTTNNHSNDDGTTENYSPPTGWADGDTLKSATTSYNGSDTATLTSDSGSSGPTEKYNAAAGFTIISYSGDGSTDGDSQTLDHSLGVPLEFVIAKGRTNNDSMDNGNWVVYHKDLTSGDYLTLNSSSASDTPYNSNDLIATSVSGSQHSVVVSNDTDSAGTDYLYLNSGPDNGTGEDYILYGWAGVEGYSKFGKYIGNSSSDGPFVYTGFRPRYLMINRVTSSDGGWKIMDTARDPHNVVTKNLYAHSSDDEDDLTSHSIDLLSNGFKWRTSGNHENANGHTYIYAAFAESPFKHANAR